MNEVTVTEVLAQLEAFASRGYSMLDCARLLGKNTRRDFDGREHVDAYNRGANRWRESGSPPPQRVVDLIREQVQAQLRIKEMSRGELREMLGYDHGEINLAIEALESQFLIQRVETATMTFFRANGVSANVSGVQKSGRVETIIAAPAANKLRTLEASEQEDAVGYIETPETNLTSAESVTQNHDADVTEATITDEPVIGLCKCGRPQDHRGVCQIKLCLTYQEIEDQLARGVTFVSLAAQVSMAEVTLRKRRATDKKLDAAMRRGTQRFLDAGGMPQRTITPSKTILNRRAEIKSPSTVVPLLATLAGPVRANHEPPVLDTTTPPLDAEPMLTLPELLTRCLAMAHDELDENMITVSRLSAELKAAQLRQQALRKGIAAVETLLREDYANDNKV